MTRTTCTRCTASPSTTTAWQCPKGVLGNARRLSSKGRSPTRMNSCWPPRVCSRRWSTSRKVKTGPVPFLLFQKVFLWMTKTVAKRIIYFYESFGFKLSLICLVICSCIMQTPFTIKLLKHSLGGTAVHPLKFGTHFGFLVYILIYFTWLQRTRYFFRIAFKLSA